MANKIERLNSKHLTKESPQPPMLEPGKIRLYNMRYCAFGHRLLLALRMKNIPFEVVNINTDRKPEWFFEKNPLGKVPAIEHDGKFIYESFVCVDYINDIFKTGRNLVPEDPFERAKQRMMTERLSGMGLALFPFFKNLHDPIHIKKVEDGIQLHESLLQDDYFAGAEPGYADLMCWPWIEWLEGVAIMSEGRVAVRNENYPKLAAYIERMKKMPEIKEFMLDGETFVKCLRAYLNGNDLDNLDK